MRGMVVLIVVLVAQPFGCKTSSLSAGGHTVAAVTARPAGSCHSLGTITGQGGGSGCGGWVSNDDLVRYAMNDLRNQAAAKGATHVEHGQPQLGSAEGTTTTATVVGTALSCTSDTTVAGGPAAGPAPPGTHPPAPGTHSQEPPGYAGAPPTTRAAPTDAPPRPSPAVASSIRAGLDQQRDAILACAARPQVAVRVRVTPDGSLEFSLGGELANSPEEECVRQALGDSRVAPDGSTGDVIHLVRSTSSSP